MWRAAFLTFTLFGNCFGQAAPPKGRVEGRVINQAGQPLANATVALVGNNRTAEAPLPPAYTSTSDATGDFSFEDIEPNTYRLFAQRSGYLEFVYTLPDGRVVIPVAEGERRNIEVKMTAPSFLSGRVTDENGEPFPDARVTVYHVNRVNGKRQLTAFSPVPAGRDGGFSTGNLRAGRYYLAASNPPSLTLTNQREVRGSKSGDARYVTTYYPSALDTSSATLIDLPVGTDRRNLDIRLRKARVFHIYGRIVNMSGAPVANATVNLLYPEIGDPAGNAHRIYGIEGAFQVNGLLPGTYAFQGWSGASRELQGHQIATITDRDIENLVLTLVPGLDIPLSVRIEGADDPQKAQAIRNSLGRFTLTASDGVNSNAMAQAKDDGWIFHNIGPGTYRMGLGGPDGTYVKSIRFGNQDVTRSELDTTSGSGALEMVLSTHAAEVTGAVLVSNGQPLSGVTVTLWMPGLPPPGTLDPARSTVTDAKGRFQFGNLRPGEYRMAAWERIEPGMGNLSEFHVKFDGMATIVKLGEDSRETLQPVLISREKVEVEAAKLQ
jgi:protocatechuate 3,4-dioxygenase beta subunit